MNDEWQKGSPPSVEVEESDMTSICIYLSADAFIEWEDTVGNQHSATFSLLKTEDLGRQRYQTCARGYLYPI